MPTETILAVGTRSVILSLMKLITNNSSLAPATIWPTPWAGYTTNSLVLKPCRWVVFLIVADERPLWGEERNYIHAAIVLSLTPTGNVAPITILLSSACG